MPSRRRRFSVQRDIAGKTVRNPNKSSNASQPCCKTSFSQSQPEPEKPGKRLKNSDNVPKPGKAPQTNPITTPLESKETASNPSLTNTIVNKKSSRDKHVTASSSNIDLYAMLNMIEVETDSVREIQEFDQKRETKQAETRRDKHPRQHQHRVKVRSPKRRMNVAGCVKVADNVVSVGTDIIDWDRESDEYMIMTESNTETILSAVISNDRREDRESSHSLDDMCRICHGGEAPSLGLGHLISACSCRGTVGRVHVRCLERWLTESGKSRCELCGTRYATRRVHRYGVPRSLIMWILSHNAKQLMVDSLGIMLMSPLAVLAAWLSGRTLAGLMTQDSHITPWPLASTFVLACMTLVCYYCWIVSAATRHALGWWIWYRSQYEVRLQLEGNEE